jgi:hypothetical protein
MAKAEISTTWELRLADVSGFARFVKSLTPIKQRTLEASIDKILLIHGLELVDGEVVEKYEFNVIKWEQERQRRWIQSTQTFFATLSAPGMSRTLSKLELLIRLLQYRPNLLPLDLKFETPEKLLALARRNWARLRELVKKRFLGLRKHAFLLA